MGIISAAVDFMIPEHIGIIPDGNRRLARRLLEKPWKGHEWGLGKIKDIMRWSKEIGIRDITVYVLSLENLRKRPKKELDYLFALAKEEMKDIIGNKKNSIHKNKVKVRFFGRLEKLPSEIRVLIKGVEKSTSRYRKHRLNLAMAYGGRQEIESAMKRMSIDAKKGIINPDKINGSLIRSYLQTNGAKDPEIILRTGGEKRLSNFLTYQSVYSELIFLERMWPELSRKDFLGAIREFESRKRRFGK